MRGRITVLIAVVGITVSGSAIAAALAPSPMQLLLRKSDFPTAAKYTSGQMPASFSQGLRALGVTAQGAFLSVQVATGTTKYRSIDGFVVVTDSAGQARTAFAAFKKEQALGFDKASRLRLPSYGDEQLALLQAPKLGSGASLLVRKNTTVWLLDLSGGGLQVIPRATLIAELQKYARKQKTLVGAG